MAEILKEADAGSGSFYHFFASKEALLAAVLDWYVEQLEPRVMGPVFAASPEGIERVFAVLRAYREWLCQTEFKRGCPIGNLALEVGDSLPAVREKIALNFARWCQAIERCLEAGSEQLPSGLDRARLSRFVLTVMEGGMMQARSHRRIEPFDEAIACLRDYFDRLMLEARAEKESGPGI